jgi:hypothetical protein
MTTKKQPYCLHETLCFASDAAANGKAKLLLVIIEADHPLNTKLVAKHSEVRTPK